MNSENYPFESNPDDSDNLFDLDENAKHDIYVTKAGSPETFQKPTLEVDSVSKYTSLEPEHVPTTMMRSLSVDDSDDVTFHHANESLDEVRDLVVRVESPEKHVEGYVSYNIVTKTTRDDFEQKEYEVRRRYQDFLWLREKLEETNPTHLIPPLPEKFTFSKHIKDRFDEDFLKTRRRALHKFVARIAEHPVLSFSEHFRTFLTAKAWEMVSARKTTSTTAQRFGGSVRNATAQLMMKNRGAEFIEMAKYNIQFRGKVAQFAKVADEVAKERFYLLDDMAEYGSAFRLWANSESKLGETLSEVSKSLDKNVDSLRDLLRVHETRISEPVREYILYCDSVRDALKRRDNFQLEFELTAEELSKKRQERDELTSAGQAKSLMTLFGKDPEILKQEKLEKLNVQIQELTGENEELADRAEKADEDLRADMERWQKGKRHDLKALFLEMAEQHIKHYEANIKSWEEALASIKKPKRAPSE